MKQSLELTQVTEWQEGKVRSLQDCLAVEEPLEIRLCAKPLAVTMRTPGQDKELAAGFLWTEGLIDEPAQILALRQSQSVPGPQSNVVEVDLAGDDLPPQQPQRNFVSGSGCGVCGKASIEAIRGRNLHRPNGSFTVAPEVLCALPGRLRQGQKVFGRTGGLHAAALFDGSGKLLALREDIGRHNAVDKLVGWALLGGLLPLSNHVLMVSGRGGFEIAQKAIAAGVPILASVSAPSSLAVRLAREFDLSLVGFLRGRRFVIYSGASRFQAAGP